MSPQYFKVKEHVVEGQYIREYVRALAFAQEDTVRLAVKQYIPLDNPNPQPGDVTIIGAHANGFPKELYEALWDELYLASKSQGFRIRSIWIADAAHQGQSSVLNEHVLGNDPSWLDHPRDLLNMINHFRKEMPLPLVGIGHSFGGCSLAGLALLNPRLLTSLVLLDPVLVSGASDPSSGATRASSFRRDVWPSREEAVKSFAKSPFYSTWDKRVFDAWCTHGLRTTPTAIHPSASTPAGAVTLTTTKHQECFTFMRPLYEDPSNGPLGYVNHTTHPDIDPRIDTQKTHFYQPGPMVTFQKLRALRPSVLYILGGDSFMNSPELEAEKIEHTGVGLGGSGGAPKDRVRKITLPKVGHLIAMEAPKLTADHAASWIGREMGIWREEKRKYEEWTKLPLAQKQTMSPLWLEKLGGDPRAVKKKFHGEPAKL